MGQITHRTIETNGIRMQLAEAGSGPLVLLCHGWPESWYSWRHQLPALASAGYHAVAPDMRGYGRTDAPPAVESYTVMHLIADLLGVLDALRESRAVIVGHDWGSIVAWNAALLRPDRFPAVVGMSVPFMPRGPIRPTEQFRAFAGDRFMYVLYFQEPGKAERELDPNARTVLRRVLWSASGSAPRDGWRFDLPKSAGLIDTLAEPPSLPSWLSQEDLDFYVTEFERTGFRGGLNWYRNFDRNWELLAPFADLRVRVPALFVGGLRDWVVTGPGGSGESEGVKALPEHCTDLRGKVLLDGIGHWNQQEAPEATGEALLEFLAGLR